MGAPLICDREIVQEGMWAEGREKKGYPRPTYGQNCRFTNNRAEARVRLDRSARIAAVVADMGQLLQEGLEHLWAAGLDRDLGQLEAQVQQVFRRAGGCLLVGLAEAQVATLEQRRPSCAQCGRDLRRVGVRPR